MRIFKKCVLVLLLLIVVSVAVIAYIQRDNIKALIDARRYSPEELEQQMLENRQVVADTLERYSAPKIRDFTPSEEEEIRKGELSVEEAVDRILSEAQTQGGAVQEGADAAEGSEHYSDPVAAQSEDSDITPYSPNTQESKTQEDPVASLVTDYTVRMYALKADYLGRIGNLLDSAKAEVKSGKSLSSLAGKYIDLAGKLEFEADTKVEALVSELEQKLNSLGADTSIANVMRTAYQKEKSLKKSYYMSLYEEKK